MHDAGAQQMTQPYRLKRLTPPTEEPVTVGEAKLHARIDEDADNAAVMGFIKAARELAETYTRKAFVTQTWQMFLDDFPACSEIELPRPPLSSVTHVKAYDDADAATVFASSNYFVDTATQPGRLVLRDAASWPDAERVANAVEVQFIAGTTVDLVPQAIKQGIFNLVAWLYEHRGDGMEPPDACYAPLVGERIWLV